MSKRILRSISEKNRIIDRIIDAVTERSVFLLLGHTNPDEDCISSMVAFSLLLSKFMKNVQLCLPAKVHEHFHYLINICRYNSIKVHRSCDDFDNPFDTLVILDTPKPSMIESNDVVDALLADESVCKIEIDHHIGADSAYIGDEGYCLVTDATSASELVGHIILKLCKKPDVLQRFQIENPFTRNIVLAILTGIIGDTNMGRFIKSRREKTYYNLFSTMFNRMLAEKTVKETNFKNIGEVFGELQRLSAEEDRCYAYFDDRKHFSDSIGYVALNAADMESLLDFCDVETVVSVARAMANDLAEQSGKLSLVSYYDVPSESDLVQFRVRRQHDYKKYDLRNILEMLSIENGGGHEGAIGFRVPQGGIDDYEGYIEHMIGEIERVIP